MTDEALREAYEAAQAEGRRLTRPRRKTDPIRLLRALWRLFSRHRRRVVFARAVGWRSGWEWAEARRRYGVRGF